MRFRDCAVTVDGQGGKMRVRVFSWETGAGQPKGSVCFRLVEKSCGLDRSSRSPEVGREVAMHNNLSSRADWRHSQTVEEHFLITALVLIGKAP